MEEELSAMKNSSTRFIWALCLALAGVWACNAEAVPTKTPESYEKATILAGLRQLGIGEGYGIVVGDECDPVENTAAEMLQRFLAKASLPLGIVTESQFTGDRRILLGRESNLKAIQDFGDRGDIDIRSVSADDDGFHVRQIGKDVLIAGANPRGVLYGVYAFEDFVKKAGKSKLDIRRIPQFASRILSVPFVFTSDHPSSYKTFSDEWAAHYSRLGKNGVIDGGGGGWDLSRFVSSDIFPFQKPPDPELQRRISRASFLCRKYGMGYYIMLWEPETPRVGDLGKYPKEALGTVKRPWGGDEHGMARTLCVCSPIVQEHYRNMVKRFAREYPDVKGFLFYNLDGNAWLCTPGLCPRCKSVCTDSPPDTPHPWETQALFTDLLAQAAREERSDFEFIHWISHFHGAAAEKLVRTSQEYTALAYGVQNGDHDIMISDAIEPGGSEFLMLQKVCAERSVPFHATFSSNTHEVIPNGFQLPFHVADGMQKLHAWGVRHIKGAGPIPYFNQINAMVEREFQWNPDQDPGTFIADLSVRQFGKEAGKLMYKAWEEIENGMDVWNDMRLHPFCGSQMHLGLGFSYFPNSKALVPDIAEYYNNCLVILTNVEPHRAPDYQKYREKEFLGRFQLMGTHLAEAAALAKKAIEKADANRPIGINYYDGDSVPTMKEYAELNYGPIAIADVYCRLRCNMISAYHLLEGMKADSAAGNGNAAQEKETLYHDLIREDIALRKRFVEMLTEFATMRPCLTRTSLSEEGIANQITYMNAEIEKMESYLSQDSG